MNTSAAVSPPYFIADNLALDFINTAMGAAPNRVECLNDDAQVLDWLQRAGLSAEVARRPPRAQRGSLLEAALALRETARELVSSRHARRLADPTDLNTMLARGNTYRELVWKERKKPELVQRRRVATPEDLLVPVAEAVAELIAEGDFSLVRKCENPECTLWFYDRTKSHHRRWCSMAVCGNRMKVAAFRARQKE